MPKDEELEAVLLEIAAAETHRELRLAAGSAKHLKDPAAKDLARWAYAYAREQIRLAVGAEVVGLR